MQEQKSRNYLLDQQAVIIITFIFCSFVLVERKERSIIYLPQEPPAKPPPTPPATTRPITIEERALNTNYLSVQCKIYSKQLQRTAQRKRNFLCFEYKEDSFAAQQKEPKKLNYMNYKLATFCFLGK